MSTIAMPRPVPRRVRRPEPPGESPATRARRERLLGVSVEVVDHPWFHEPDAGERVAAVEREAAAERRDMIEPEAGGRGLPGHLRALCRRPLFTPAGERAAFLRFNWERHRARTLQQRLRNGDRNPGLLDDLETALDRAMAARNDIVLANTRLVVSVARTFVGPGLSFDDLLAAGMPPLVRAVELFDVSRGYRFSTYATWAVRNRFLRVRKRHQQRRERFRTGEEATLGEVETGSVDPDVTADRAEAARTVVADLLNELDDRERAILEARFGLNGQRGDQTFAEIGPRVGLGKERVRQLTHRALARLREQAPEGPWSVGA